MTIISYINDTGGMKSDSCNKIACSIWGFSNTEKLWISAAHISCGSNNEIDKEFRILNNTVAWQSNPAI